jgi:sugar phosphate isomerase/epimerase
LSEIGIKNIELFDAATLSEYQPIIKNYGMNALCCHCMPGYVSGKWDQAKSMGFTPSENYTFDHILEDCNGSGIKYIGVAIMMPEERETIDDYKRFAEQMNLAGEKSRDAGVQLYYHNHSFEFQPHGDAIPMQEMITIFDPELVKIELDAFWVTIAGNNPIEWMNKLGNQLLFIHLKDLKKETPLDYTVFEVEQEAFVELGEGIVDFKSVLTKARSMGIKYALIDQDNSQLEMMESIRRNYEFVKDLGI